MSLVAREDEIRTLENIYSSESPEFMAIYGRRRVGKTYLVRKFFETKAGMFFNVTGSQNGRIVEQIAHFIDQISKVFYGGIALSLPTSWDEAFKLLTTAIESQVAKDSKIVLFFDELPWMATRNSRLLEALDYYWNQHWSNDKRIKLIICGSSASWIVNKIINNKGGLHNRVTKQIYLEPFNLAQTKLFFDHHEIKLTYNQVLLLYMVIGGVPYYLSQVEKGLSASQAIERLAFSKKSFLLNEFDNLFSSLFDNSDIYVQIVRLLAEYPNGIGERNLLEKLGTHAVGGTHKKKLKDLEQTGFIMSFKPLFHKKKGIYYRLTDEYVLFYLKWIDPMKNGLQKESLDHGNWQVIQTTPAWYSWLGYAFETVCYKHIAKIASTWRYVPKKGSKHQGAQIDLLFDRQDDAITLCEIKYSDKPFVLSKEYVEILHRKMQVFKEQTRTKKQLFTALVAANGLQNNPYVNALTNNVVTLEDFFKN
jgi:AAA+ ATPase superfamily predicted ATPase